MGGGEDYYNQFYRWFSNLDAEKQDAYALENNPPFGWRKIYTTIRKHPWP